MSKKYRKWQEKVQEIRNRYQGMSERDQKIEIVVELRRWRVRDEYIRIDAVRGKDKLIVRLADVELRHGR